MSKISLTKSKPTRYIPTRHENALRLLFDPYRQQRAGWKNYKSDLNIDYSLGGITYSPNLYANTGVPGQADWEDSNTDGLADGWTVVGNGTASIVTGNGFRGNAQKLVFNDTSTTYMYAPSFTVTTGERFLLSFKYRSNEILGCSNGIAASWPANTANAVQIKEVINSTYTGAISFRWYIPNNVASDWFEISEVSIQRLGNGSHGKSFGDLYTTGWGIDPAAIKLDGSNDYINYGDQFNINYSSFLVFSWFHSTNYNAGSYKNLIYKYKDTANNFYVRYLFRRFYFYAEVGGPSYSNFSNAQILTADDDWYLAVVTVDREGATDDMVENYINNVADTPENQNWWDENTNYTHVSDWIIGNTPSDGKIGITGIYLFDGQNGAESSMPSDITDLVSDIYTTMGPLYQ
jgi:hypothetical protein